MLLEDGDQFLLEAVGSGLVIFGVSPQICSDGFDQAVGERERGLRDEGCEGLGELLQGPKDMTGTVSENKADEAERWRVREKFASCVELTSERSS